MLYIASQSQNVFEAVGKTFELNLDIISANNFLFNCCLWYFNVRSNLWYKNNKMTNEGSKVDRIASQFGFHQFTHLSGNIFSCLELIFISQPNLVMESGVHFSLQENCHHNLCKMQSKNLLPISIWTGSLALSEDKYRKYRKIDKWNSLRPTFCKYWC